MLHLVAKLTGVSRAKLTQITVEYDPQPPFGRIDWAHVGPLPRVMRGGISLAAPVITAKPMRLTELMRGKSAEVPDGTT